jgi:RNA polymerase sigma factor (sigma-70 family)
MFTTVSFLVSRLPELNDRHAWSLFEQRYTPLLRRYFLKSGCRSEAATDLAQEAIQNVALGLRNGRFRRGEGRLRDWIGGIARNVLRAHRRRTRAESHQAQPATQFWSQQPDPAAEGEVLAADERFDALWVRTRLAALLRLAAERFDRRDLHCYFLVEIRKLPIREAAKRTGLSESSVFQKRRQVAAWLLAVGPRFISRWEQ